MNESIESGYMKTYNIDYRRHTKQLSNPNYRKLLTQLIKNDKNFDSVCSSPTLSVKIKKPKSIISSKDESLKYYFNRYDKTSKGYMNSDELENFLINTDIDYHDSYINNLVKYGRINYDDFVKLMEYCSKGGM